ncbi:MAG: hypothetical protein R6W95_16245 [Desulfosarcina sp.]
MTLGGFLVNGPDLVRYVERPFGFENWDPYLLETSVPGIFAAGDPLTQRTFAPFSDLLRNFLIEKSTTEGGLVSAFDYRGAMADAQAGGWLQEQRRRLAQFDVTALKTREQAIAFWVNTYNFFMAAHILENPKGGQPVTGVKDYGSLFNPYRVFRQKLFNFSWIAFWPRRATRAVGIYTIPAPAGPGRCLQ